MRKIGVAGAGTMGAGIAELAALAGFDTALHDPDPGALAAGMERIEADLERGIARERLAGQEADAARSLLASVDGIEGLGDRDLIVEAAPEKLELKRELFARLEGACASDAVLATNTSSLSVTAIAAEAAHPERIVGMHFFNPPTRLELVEVVAGDASSAGALDATAEVARAMGRTPIRARDGIGFVANRCSRPFTLEPLRMLGEGLGSHDEIDRVCRVGGGFRMGPFELLDLIGIDVNLSVARSFFEQSFGEPRWRPHPIQTRMASSGRLGRKAGRGFYDYGEGEHRPPDPAVDLDRPVLDDAELERLCGPSAPAILGRLLCQLVNEAVFAFDEGVASAADIDTAMRLGFNWPLGPLELGHRLGWGRGLRELEELRGLYGEAYRPAPLLRRLAAGESLPA